MRGILVAAMLVGAAQCAQAADMPDYLRGSFSDDPPVATRNWDGWYVGGQVGYSSADVDFSHAAKSLTNTIFRNSNLQDSVAQWSLLNKNHTQSVGFGGFVGRNYQADDLVFGIEANYNYINKLASSSSNSMALALAPPSATPAPPNHTYTYNTSLTGAAALQIKDVVTLRGRAGWATGNFLPYLFGGLAVGRMEVSRSATSKVVLQDDEVVTTTDGFGNTTSYTLPSVYSNIPSVSQTVAEGRSNSLVVGYTGGLGMEYMMWNNVFMRAEWEYIKFLSVKDISVSMNSARFGIGYKF